MTIRDYDPDGDGEAVRRIWREVGWVDSEEGEAVIDLFMTAGRALVSDLDHQPECAVASMPGVIRYLEQDLTFSGVTAVVTGRAGRRQGLANRLTAALIAADAQAGTQVSGLGMFEQGFYNRLGYGTGSYEHWIGFDPVHLRIERHARPPRRITREDWAPAHAALLARRRGHGACNLFPPQLLQAEMVLSKGFGLGYADGPNGELTHFFWSTEKDENGPYAVLFMAYQDWDQFLELMATIKSLADQVHLVHMREPAAIVMQDLLSRPFRYRNVTRHSKFEQGSRTAAYWQVRICDLPGCLAGTHLPGQPLRFNLRLHDPIERYLDENAPWRGAGGEYVVTLGPESHAAAGSDPALPTLTASVGAFSRLWLGVRPATGLAVTDQLHGPPALLQALDRLLRLPKPSLDWDF